MFTNTFSNEKMNYIINVDLDELYNLSIQKFFIWDHLVSHLTNFTQNTYSFVHQQKVNRIIVHHTRQAGVVADGIFGFDAHQRHLFLLFSYLLDAGQTTKRG